MFLFSIVALFSALVLTGIGLAIGLFACALAGILLSAGVVSTSVLIALRSSRPALGVRAFLLQCGVLAGVPAGAICAWLAQTLFVAYDSGWAVLLAGAVGGALSGLVIALGLDLASRRLHAWAVAQTGTPRRWSPPTADDGDL